MYNAWIFMSCSECLEIDGEGFSLPGSNVNSRWRPTMFGGSASLLDKGLLSNQQSAKERILYLFGNIVITRFVACGEFFFQIKKFKLQVICLIGNLNSIKIKIQ